MELSLNILHRTKVILHSNINNFEHLQNWFIENGYPNTARSLADIISTNREELAVIETFIITHSNYQNECP